MEKVYLLLRNNLQTGPYNIDELLQQQLKPLDLIWVEGKSLAWSYPSEVSELNPHVKRQKTFSKSKNPLSSTHSSPASDEIEKKAEELRQRALSYIPKQFHLRNQLPIAGYYPIPYKPERAITFIDHRKEKHNTTVEYLTAGMITVFIGASLYGGSLFFNRNPVVAHPSTTQIVTTEENAAKKINRKTIVENPANIDSVLIAEIKPKPLISKRKCRVKARVKPVIKLETQTIPANVEDVATPIIQNPIEVEDKKELIVPENTTELNEKKKTLGQAIKGLFKKKKKERKSEE